MIAVLNEIEEKEKKSRAKRSVLWLGIISIIMLFAGLTSGYIVRQGEGRWVQFDLPAQFQISTVLVVLSSLFMQFSLGAIRKDQVKKFYAGILLTAILGGGFVYSQYIAWSELFNQGIAFTGHIRDIKTDFTYIPAGTESVAEAGDAGNVAGSFLYVITGLHVLHLLGGIIALIIVLSRGLLGRYSSSNHNGVRMCAIYWHFLGALWVYLFFFLLYVR